MLWEEYRQQHPDGYGYSWFCEQYRNWKKMQDLVMRQYHAPGDQRFVDYAGKTVEVYDPDKGENVNAQIFVAVLGYSNHTYAKATGSQSSRDWLASHCRAFEYLGAVPAVVVPDNLKATVRKAHHYDPELNPAYSDLARHYGITVLPTRVKKPRDNRIREALDQGIARAVKRNLMRMDSTGAYLDSMTEVIPSALGIVVSLSLALAVTPRCFLRRRFVLPHWRRCDGRCQPLQTSALKKWRGCSATGV